jgi:imidazolonepropionase-like amidohydrolase
VTTTLVFENVTVIPMNSEQVLDGQTVVIEEGRIAGIGKNGEVDIPNDAFRVDADGKFLIPGLSDMHIHTNGVENDLLVYLANGVTTVRTMGGGPKAMLKWRDETRAGTRIAPRIWAWWPSIEDTLSQYADSVSMEELQTRGGIRFVFTAEEAEALVAEMAALGVDGVKAHDIASSDVYLALLESANKYGLPLDGHIPMDQLDCWDCFREMDAPAVAHIEELIKFERWSDDDLRQIAREAAGDGLSVTTTLYLMRSIDEQGNGVEASLAALPEVKYVHPWVYNDKGWKPEKNYYSNIGSAPWFTPYLAAQEKLMPMLNESGALLMSGTDASVPLAVPGFSLHQELETLADVGLSPYDVLRTSTYNPALYLGELDEFGTIEVGKRADLVLLNANPLDDVSNTKKIAGVVVRGRYFDRTDLDTILDLVAQDFIAYETNFAIARIIYPIVVVSLLVGLVWFFIRRARQRKASQITS